MEYLDVNEEDNSHIALYDSDVTLNDPDINADHPFGDRPLHSVGFGGRGGPRAGPTGAKR